MAKVFIVKDIGTGLIQSVHSQDRWAVEEAKRLHNSPKLWKNAWDVVEYEVDAAPTKHRTIFTTIDMEPPK